MQPTLPLTRDIVLVGGGHTHALVLRKWGMNPLPGARLTVINPGPTAPYSGMLPGFVAGHYDRRDLDIDLVQLARFAGARVVVGRAEALDPVARTVTVPGRPPIAYDVASVDIGITSEMPDLPGFADHAIPAKPLGPFAAKWDAFRKADGSARVAVIGGGVAGAELAMAMAHALKSRGREAQVHLIDRGEIVEEFNAAARAQMLKALAANGVTPVEGAAVTGITETAVLLEDGREIASEFTTGAAGARPQGWLAETGLETHRGFLTVGPTLQTSDSHVFAVGDCAHLGWNPRPKAGVYAVREAPVLFDNLRAAATGRRMRSYRPQKDYLKLVSLGGKRAMAEKFGTAQSGKLLWRWKDRIDRKFMDQFRDLEPMGLPELPVEVAEGVRETLGDKPMCAGCGAKVGRGALRAALAGLPAPTRDDIASLPGDDAAILITGGARQVLTTDHLRAVTEDPVLMTRIAAHHALGDIWAMGATPQAATATIILPRMSAELQERTLAEITAAAQEVLHEAGAALVGGHTSQGDELTLGFSITGLCAADPITLAGAQPGDMLILTKPIGSGTILAAEMLARAHGDDVLACLDLMGQSQGRAAAILRDAHAMTDITGFGLAGHLSGICEASGVGAELRLSDIPLMAGAEALAEAGIRSTLYADNVAGAAAVTVPTGARGALMFDPQTAGGLLAAVPGDAAEARVGALRAAGYAAATIGKVVGGSGVRIR